MTIEQTVTIPNNRRLNIEVPREVPTGRTILTFTPAPPAETVAEPAVAYDTGTLIAPENAERAAAIEKLFGSCMGAGDSLDGYMERHWADNDLERAIAPASSVTVFP
jgi:hypothetical protein